MCRNSVRKGRARKFGIVLLLVDALSGGKQVVLADCTWENNKICLGGPQVPSSHTVNTNYWEEYVDAHCELAADPKPGDCCDRAVGNYEFKEYSCTITYYPLTHHHTATGQKLTQSVCMCQ